MPLEERVPAEPCAGSLSACLVDGNAEQNTRERNSKRRALAISVSLQTIGLTALVIAPLLAKPADLAMRTVPPMPIYRSAPKPVTVAQPPHGPIHTFCDHRFHNLPPMQVVRQTIDVPPGPLLESPPGPETPEGAIAILTVDSKPKPPHEKDQPRTPKKVVMTHIDPALLTRRVEPVYPALARQTRRSGRVELHALIGTDGSVQSLQLVSGDPLFVQSALDAVKQWRYQPTKLNGTPVEVDTYITVIYTLHE